MLDIARRTYTESVADVTGQLTASLSLRNHLGSKTRSSSLFQRLAELANQMRDMHSVEDLSVAYNQQRGFFFRTSVEPSNLPAIFERVER